MRILLVIHVGETLGHLVRGLSVANELARRGAQVEIAFSPKAHNISALGLERYRIHTLRWNWSHNSCEPEAPTDTFLSNVLQTAEDLLHLIRRIKPDAIVGMPGFATSQIARSMNIPHFCIMHGPYLAPVTRLAKQHLPVANAVLSRATAMCQGAVNACFHALSEKFVLPAISYDDFLSSEYIFCAQPGLELDLPLPNVRPTSFIIGSLGSPIEENFPAEFACYMSFGSGNSCNLQRVVDLVANVFPYVIVSAGKVSLQTGGSKVYVRPFISDASLAGRVQAVICHGGIGTVGAFASVGTPMLLVPTELDQAVMTVHALNMGIALQCGVESVSRRTKSGRRLPDFTEDEFLQQLQRLKSLAPREGLPSSGAEEIADTILNPAHVARVPIAVSALQGQHA